MTSLILTEVTYCISLYVHSSKLAVTESPMSLLYGNSHNLLHWYNMENIIKSLFSSFNIKFVTIFIIGSNIMTNWIGQRTLTSFTGRSRMSSISWGGWGHLTSVWNSSRWQGQVTLAWCIAGGHVHALFHKRLWHSYCVKWYEAMWDQLMRSINVMVQWILPVTP